MPDFFSKRFIQIFLEFLIVFRIFRSLVKKAVTLQKFHKPDGLDEEVFF